MAYFVYTFRGAHGQRNGKSLSSGHTCTLISLSSILFLFVAQVFICTLVLMVSNTNGAMQVPDNVISEFLQNFIKPFLRSVNVSKPNSTEPPITDTKIVKLIRKKVIELKPVLQDDDEMIETEDNLTLHGNDETTLIEFLPKSARRNKDGSDQPIMLKSSKDPLKTSINKYKDLRGQINLMLDEEKITASTKSLILTTLDEMIAQLIESQCNWNPDKKLLQSHNETSASLSKLQNMTKKQWKKLRHHYMDYLTNRKEKETSFMNRFHNFFSNVINDTNNLQDKYKIRCQLVQISKKKDLEKSSLREKKVVEKDTCENFKLCSDEMSAFFNDFYNYVNDTAVSVFRNYASMYVRDVNIDFGIDKEVVVSVINSLGNMAEHKVIKIYRNELQRFRLDPDKKKNANVNHINNFISNVVLIVKDILKANLVKELGAMKTKLFMTIKEDLSVNLEVDMENLERHYIDSICTTFVLCNGRYSARRTGEPWTFRPKANSEVFVKVQLSLDDEMKNAVAKSGLLEYFKKPAHKKLRINKKPVHKKLRHNKAKHHMRAIADKYLNVSVTRTTIGTPRVPYIPSFRSVQSNEIVLPTVIVLDNITRISPELNLTNEIELIST